MKLHNRKQAAGGALVSVRKKSEKMKTATWSV